MGKDKFLWLCFFLSLVISVFFFGNVLRSPNNYLFSSGGDGLQTYYQSIYHTKFDVGYLHQQGLNYPYGESIFFTGGQPLASNIVKLLMPVVDLSDYMVGITNLMMLLGLLLCPIFLYLILKRLGLDGLFAALFAVGITFISQQMERMGGHYPLAWLYAIPGMIYCMLRFYETYSWKWSITTSVYMLFLIYAHVYYLVFFGAIAFGFWCAFILFNKERKLGIWKSLLHVTVQLVVPFIVLQLFIRVSSDVSDRTAIPWGFIVYRSATGGYLFPYGMWYEKFFLLLKPKQGVEWEGLAYVGGTAILMGLSVFSYSVFRLKQFFGSISKWENKVFLSLTIAIVFCFAASFAFPFNYGFENLLNKLGALQQFRGIGRFAFVAFYMINILLIALFWKISFRNRALKWIIASAFLLLMSSEAYTRVSRLSEGIANDRKDLLKVHTDEFIESIRSQEFQAMLPYPFFHIGSENVGSDCDASVKNHIYDLSVKTGLPTFAASMSRTSLRQSFNNLAIAQELMEVPKVIGELKSNDPILLVCDESAMLPNQHYILNFAERFSTSGNFSYYKILPDAFAKAHLAMRDSIAQIDVNFLHKQMGNAFLSDSNAVVLVDSSLFTGAFDLRWMRYAEHAIPDAWHGKSVVVSFWVKNFQRDLLPRTSLEVHQKNGEETTGYFVEYIGKRFVGMKNGDALIECVVPIDSRSTQLLISFENKLIQGQKIECSGLLIRPEGVDCLILRNDSRFLNNRNYH